MTYVMSTELYHHGIKGQKWGIRRFQNPDGTLTEAGRKRYGTVENLKAKRTLKQINKEESEKKKAISSGKVADIQKISTKLTDEEMAEAFKRISYEQKLAQLKNIDIANGQEKAAKIIAAGATIKDAAKTMTDIYNLAATTYNSFNKSGNKLPIIGEKKESIDDITKRFNLIREQQRFKWEVEDHGKPKDVNWSDEVKRMTYEKMVEDANDRAAKREAERILNNPQFGRTSWEKATYDTSGATDMARASWEQSTYSTSSNRSGSSNAKSSDNHYSTNEQRRSAYKEVVAKRDQLKEQINNDNLSSSERRILVEEYREVAKKAEELRE